MATILGLVSFKIFPARMGGQKGVTLFYQYLKDYHRTVLALSIDNPFDESPETIRILYPNKKIYRNYFKIHALQKMVAEFTVNLIIAEHSYTGWIAWMLSRATRKPFIIHSHNIEAERFRQMKKWWWKGYWQYERWIHRKAHHNFFISEEDKTVAVNQFRLNESKCSVITYGTEEKKIADRDQVRDLLSLDKTKKIFLFNGTLDYKPNRDAVHFLADIIHPMLLKRFTDYEIIITGARADAGMIHRLKHLKNFSYKGYVDDIDAYYQAADLFLNPVLNDSGIKTKLIEAIANHCTSLSTVSGASGIQKQVCGKKLVTIRDNDWNSFAEKIIEFCHQPYQATPQIFYEYYSWKNVAKKAAEKISTVIEST